jgi:hypothetical protein
MQLHVVAVSFLHPQIGGSWRRTLDKTKFVAHIELANRADGDLRSSQTLLLSPSLPATYMRATAQGTGRRSGSGGSESLSSEFSILMEWG